MVRRCAPASCRLRKRSERKSLPSKGSARPKSAPLCKALGNPSMCPNAAIARQARSCRPPRCCKSNPTPATPTSTLPCPETSAAAAPTREFERPSNKPRKKERRHECLARYPCRLERREPTRVPAAPPSFGRLGADRGRHRDLQGGGSSQVRRRWHAPWDGR